MPFEATFPDIKGLVVIKPRRFGDDRGWFMETYKTTSFAKFGIQERFVQDNLSLSALGTLRGLHFQVEPHAQGKLVTVVTGAVFDVAVDLRPDSPTMGEWFGIEINHYEPCLFYIPPGFAHGFCALEDNTRFAYKCTAEYQKNCERGIRFDDADLAINWPVADLVVSEKDRVLPTFIQTRKDLGI